MCLLASRVCRRGVGAFRRLDQRGRRRHIWPRRHRKIHARLLHAMNESMRIPKWRDVEHGENAVIDLWPPFRRIMIVNHASFCRRVVFRHRLRRIVRAREPLRRVRRRLTLHFQHQPMLRVLHELLDQAAGSTRHELRFGSLVPRSSRVGLKKKLDVVVYRLV